MIVAERIALPKTPDHQTVTYYRRRYKLEPDEDLRWIRAMAQRRLDLIQDEIDDWPEDVTRNSHINALAELTAAEAELNHRATRGTSFEPIDLGIPRHVIDEIRARASLEDEVNLVRPLRRRGSVLVAQCPFHDDHTPSFVIWPKDGRFKCFGCQVYGDVFTFVQAFSRMSFPEAAYYLSARTGVEIPRKPALVPRFRGAKARRR